MLNKRLMNEYMTVLPCLLRWEDPRRVYHPAGGTGFQNPASNCFSQLWTQHSSTKMKGQRRGTGRGMKIPPPRYTRIYSDAARRLLGPFPWTQVTVSHPISVGCLFFLMRKNHYYNLFCIKINKKQSISKPSPLSPLPQ